MRQWGPGHRHVKGHPTPFHSIVYISFCVSVGFLRLFVVVLCLFVVILSDFVVLLTPLATGPVTCRPAQ